MRLLALRIGPYEDVLRTLGRFLGTSSGRPRDVILPSGYSVWHAVLAIILVLFNKYNKHRLSEKCNGCFPGQNVK